MCDLCVIDSVKDRMLSRRAVIGRSAAAGAAGLAGGIAVAGPARAQAGRGTVEDMTHTLSAGFPTFGGEPQFFAEQPLTFAQDGYNLKILTINEHTGTHIDAPLHFSADGQSVDAIPAGRLVVPLAVIDIRERAAADPDAQVTPEDIKAWVAAHGDLPAGGCVAMNSGWAAHATGAMFRNADDDGVMHFPGFHPETAAMLLEETDLAGVAVDTLSLDFGRSADFGFHYAWLPAGRWGLECLANLDAVPASGATLVVGALKHEGGTGGPCRVFALI